MISSNLLALINLVYTTKEHGNYKRFIVRFQTRLNPRLLFDVFLRQIYQRNFKVEFCILPYTESISYNKQGVKTIQHFQQIQSSFTQSLSNQQCAIPFLVAHPGVYLGHEPKWQLSKYFYSFDGCHRSLTGRGGDGNGHIIDLRMTEDYWTCFLSHNGVLGGLSAQNDLVAFESPRYQLTLHSNDRAVWKVEIRAPTHIFARKIHDISL